MAILSHPTFSQYQYLFRTKPLEVYVCSSKHCKSKQSRTRSEKAGLDLYWLQLWWHIYSNTLLTLLHATGLKTSTYRVLCWFTFYMGHTLRNEPSDISNQGPVYPYRITLRLWSNCMDAQAQTNFGMSHMFKGSFSQNANHILLLCSVLQFPIYHLRPNWY